MPRSVVLRLRQFIAVLFLFWMGGLMWELFECGYLLQCAYGDDISGHVNYTRIWFWMTVWMFILVLFSNNLSKDPALPWLTVKAVKEAFKK